ncbi:MAG: FkbM family methyltransferase [Patescibacteria group bacterium]
MKQLIKKITPPILYEFLKKLLVKPRIFSPIWNTLTYTPVDGIQIFFDPMGPWQKMILNNSYDTFLFERLNAETLQGKVIFDIGAHIGFHSLYFARLVGPKGKVYAFEPNPKNIERFRFIRDKNDNMRDTISIFDVAVSDVLGTEEFSMSEDIESGRSSGSFINTADTIWDRETFRQRKFTDIKVKTVPLDLFKKELGILEIPDLIKIDVEGAESLVLKGAEETIRKHRPLILLEVHSMLNMFNIVLFFSSLSYELEILKEEKDGRCFVEARPKNI